MSYAKMFAAKRRVENEVKETRRELAVLKDGVTEQYVVYSTKAYHFSDIRGY